MSTKSSPEIGSKDMAIEIDDDDSILTQPTSKSETKLDTKEEVEPTKPSPSSNVNEKVQATITGKRSTKTGTDLKHSPEKKTSEKLEEKKGTPKKPRYSTHVKKHHDPKTTIPQPYRWGIRPGPIFEHRGTVTRLVEMNGKPIFFRTPKVPTPTNTSQNDEPNEDLKPPAKKMKV